MKTSSPSAGLLSWARQSFLSSRSLYLPTIVGVLFCLLASPAAPPPQSSPTSQSFTPVNSRPGFRFASAVGAFEQCPKNGVFVLNVNDCLTGVCSKPDSYVCPDRITCADGPEDYTSACRKGSKNTIYDWTLTETERIECLLRTASMQDKATMLLDQQKPLEHLSLPGFCWWNDDVHSVASEPSGTVFPVPIAQAATWSRQHIREVATAIGIEARALRNSFVDAGQRHRGEGINTYAPNVNLVRDPRWGMAMEVFGEDPLLTSELAMHAIRGFQWEDPMVTPPSSDDNRGAAPSDSRRACMLEAATCKEIGVRDMEMLPGSAEKFSVSVTRRDLWESHLPMFRACVEAEAASIMCSGNAMNGVPSCADRQLLDGVLKERFGFNGFVVSAAGAVEDLKTSHKVAANDKEAVMISLFSGLDMESGGNVMTHGLDDLLASAQSDSSSEAPRVSRLRSSLSPFVSDGDDTQCTREEIVTRVNDAVRRVLRARIRLGVLDPPADVSFNYLKNDTYIVGGDRHLHLARRVARESMVLLKNAIPMPEGKNIKSGTATHDSTPPALPLTPSRLRAVGLIGPHAKNAAYMCGDYQDVAQYKNVESYMAALNVTLQKPQTPEQQELVILKHAMGCADPACQSQQGFKEATDMVKDLVENAVKDDDTAIIVFLGLEASEHCIDSSACEYMKRDRSSYELPKGQYELMHYVKKAVAEQSRKKQIRIPIVAVLSGGSSFALRNIYSDADAIMGVWYPGHGGGFGLAELLLGRFSPTGKSPLTWYANDKDLDVGGLNQWYSTSMLNRYNDLPSSHMKKNSHAPPSNEMRRLSPRATASTKKLGISTNGKNKLLRRSAKNGKFIESLGMTYRYFTGRPTIPFGFGMSYTKFEYSGLRVRSAHGKSTSSWSDRSCSFESEGLYDNDTGEAVMSQCNGHLPAVEPCENIEVEVTVHNNGKYDAHEIVQVYVQQLGSTAPVPRLRLADFQRVFIPQGQHKTVKLLVTPISRIVVLPPKGEQVQARSTETGSPLVSTDIYNARLAVEGGAGLIVYVGSGQPAQNVPHLATLVQTTGQIDNVDYDCKV
eukprot:GHVT01033825.1.p1 GENE.GHVT01033825.1~~GHVT01033825.1.p1  ORF type:complete len:1068 (-),score=142.25 GHVT01033825.1:6749-9952(-)